MTEKQLLQLATQIRDETADFQNTAVRVGTLFIELISTLRNAMTPCNSVEAGYMTPALYKRLSSAEFQIARLQEQIKSGGGGGGGGAVAAPIEFAKVVRNVFERQNTSVKNGQLVFNTTTGHFLWEVAETILDPKFEYYLTSTLNDLAGTSPVPGQIYICDGVTYEGVDFGLNEMLKTLN